MDIRVSELNCYPIKSCQGFSLKTAEIERTGIRFDRQWIVVNESGMFVAQRGDRGLGIGIKSMCLVKTSIQYDNLVLTAPNMPQISVPLVGANGAIVEVQVWKRKYIAMDQGEDIAAWFSDFLSREKPGAYRLVRIANDEVGKTKSGGGEIAFVDEYPLLVISQPSLDDLNQRMPEPLPMNRFRPNIVITGCKPYEEDRIAHMRIGGVEFRGTTLCVRCPITTINQLSAERGKEPLKTLATYRKTKDGVVFGRYFSHSCAGTIAVGDFVEVVAWDY
jgi:uncharacterized protein YcbX